MLKKYRRGGDFSGAFKNGGMGWIAACPRSRGESKWLGRQHARHVEVRGDVELEGEAREEAARHGKLESSASLRDEEEGGGELGWPGPRQAEGKREEEEGRLGQQGRFRPRENRRERERI